MGNLSREVEILRLLKKKNRDMLEINDFVIKVKSVFEGFIIKLDMIGKWILVCKKKKNGFNRKVKGEKDCKIWSRIF